MPAISGPSDGPVAVTGASGFIGSHVVKNLVEHGYDVHACLRDTTRENKTSYLLDIDEKGPGNVTLFSCDLFKAADGDYDDAFAGCSAGFHIAADIGTDAANYGRPSPEKQYAGLVDSTKAILESCKKAGSVKRVIYTSSAAAVMGPGLPDREFNYMYTEDDWAGGSYETLEERHKGGDGKTRWTIEKAAYAKGKVDAEKAGYAFGEENGIEVISVCPCHVFGPLLGLPHNTLWQHQLGLAMRGKSQMERRKAREWNIIDVRDIAETQRLAAESEAVTNGTRYNMVANDEAGELPAHQLLDTLQELFPNHNICGGYRPEPTNKRLRARCTKAIEELGLKTHSALDTLRDTGNSLIELGIVPEEVK